MPGRQRLAAPGNLLACAEVRRPTGDIIDRVDFYEHELSVEELVTFSIIDARLRQDVHSTPIIRAHKIYTTHTIVTICLCPTLNTVHTDRNEAQAIGIRRLPL